ncbi:MAG: glycosyltransferase family 39 protein [Chloroflexi bacterium]|nr:glycosyltransferase family 39 protein [Chloroflexota bacterium]
MDKIRHNTLMWRWTAIALFLLWLFFSLGSYYLVQKPFSLLQLMSLAEDPFIWRKVDWSAAASGRTLVDLLVGVWLVLVAGGCGRTLLRLSRWTAPSLLAEIVLSIGLGWGAMGLLMLALGALQLYRPVVFTGLAVGLSLVAAPSWWSWLKLLRPRLRQWSRPSPLVLFYLLVVIGVALTTALLPPTSWDGLFYHLKGPKLYLQAGGLIGGIDIPHLSFPSLLEMVFLWAIALRGDTVAQLVHFSFVFLLMGIVTLLAREWLKLTQSRIAVLLLFTMPMFLSLGTWAYNDLALAFYSAAALYLLGLWFTEPDSSKPLVLSGVMAGLAMSLKYTSLITPLILSLFIVWQCRSNWRAAWRAGLTFALPAGLVVAPWLIKNWLLTGNPVYPFVFGGKYWDGYRAAAYAEVGTGIGFDPIAILRLPYDLTLGLQDASQDGVTGPLFLTFLPLLLLVGLSKLRLKTPPGLNYLLWFAGGHYLFWLIGVISSGALRQSRLLLPAFIVLCPVMAWLWQEIRQLDHPQFSLRRFLNIALGLVLFLGLVNQLLRWLPEAPWAYLFGQETRSANLERRLGSHFIAMERLNADLPPESVVLFLWEPRSYYCDLDCRPDSILDRWGHLEYLYGDAAGIAAAWQQQGVTHVLLWRTALDFIESQQADEGLYAINRPLLTELTSNYLQPVTEFGGYELYLLP